MKTTRSKQWKTVQAHKLLMWKRVDTLILFLSCLNLVTSAQPSDSSDAPFPKDLIRQKVIATINETLPCKPKKKDGDSYIWTLNGVKIDLWNSYSGIRLLIEKTK